VLYEGVKHEIVIKEYELDKLKNENLVNWRHIHPQRARSNNSVLLLRDEVTKEEFEKIVTRTKEFGEPGFVFGNHPWQLFNPCFEVGFIPVTKDGICGVQFCNLTSQNGRTATAKEKFLENVRAQTIIGTLQASYTYFPYLSRAARDLTEDESLLGCSITGFMDSPEILLDPTIQMEGAELAKEVNEKWAKILNIPPAARINVVKPEGTSSLVLGTGSGIHAHHARRYFRRVQCNKLDNVYKFFKKNNPLLCEPSIWSANKTDDVITFPIKVGDKALVKKDLTALQHLEYIKLTQKHWVLAGTTKYNTKPVEHNVSCTVIVKAKEWADVINYLFENRHYFAAVSLLGETGDKDYPQAPMEEIVTEQDEKLWQTIVDNFKKVDYTLLEEDDDKTSLLQEGSCYGGACELKI
jgi:ribonucleoside-diphosphate reductase alpha chain